MRELTVGVLLNAEYPPAELLRLGELAEMLGYHSLWYTDVRMLRECYVGLAALAMRTSRIRLATGVTDPYSRHPAVTAASIATIDELSGGRAILGLGLGGAGFRELGIEKTLPIAALRESIDVMRRLWHGQQVSTVGKVVSIQRGRLQFPVQRPAIPIYIATQGAQVSRLAGQLADGVLIANTVVPAALDAYLQRIGEGLAKAGRSYADIDINIRWEACISHDEAAAMAVMRKRLAERLMNSYPNWDYLRALGMEIPTAFEEIAARKDASFVDAAAEMLPMEIVDASVLAGSPARLLPRIKAMLRPEVTGIIIRPHACPGTGIDDVMKSFMQDIAAHVGGRGSSAS